MDQAARTVENSVTYRGSSADLAMACPGSVNAPNSELIINTGSDAATIGTVAHRIDELIVQTGSIPPNWKEICYSYGLNEAQTNDVRFLMYSALNFWEEFGGAFPNPMTEAEVNTGFMLDGEPIGLTSHQDVLSVTEVEDGLVVAANLDWKTTRLDISYTGQMLFYAWCVCLKFPGVQEVTTAVVYLRDRSHTITKWSRQQIEEFEQRFINRVVKWDGRTYSPGGHCAYCQRFASCQAHAQMTAHVVNSLVEIPSNFLTIGPDQLIELNAKASAVSSMVEKFKKAVRARVEQAGGELVGTDGTTLKLIQSSRHHINARKAWPILSNELTEDELDSCIEVKKTPLMDAVAAHAPNRQKKAEKERVMQELRDAGSVTENNFLMLKTIQPKTQPKEIEIG